LIKGVQRLLDEAKNKQKEAAAAAAQKIATNSLKATQAGKQKVTRTVTQY